MSDVLLIEGEENTVEINTSTNEITLLQTTTEVLQVPAPQQVLVVESASEPQSLSVESQTTETLVLVSAGPQGIPGTPGEDGDDGIDGQGLPTGGTTGQVPVKASNADYDITWINLPNAAVWGNITGTLSAQTDLQDALDGKSTVGHTHVATDITDFSSAADARITAQKAAANGLATLDASTKIPLNQIPASLIGAANYQGTWNATTNSPSLASGAGSKGHYYVVATAGSTNIDGITDWKLGDWIIYNGTAWEKVDNTDAVLSVNGQTGAVNLTTTNISEGTNLYHTAARVIGTAITGFVSGAGVVAATDTILQAINKIVGNIAAIVSGSALSVYGRASNSTGSNASIAAASDFQVLRRSGTSLGFGSVNLASANAVTGLLRFANIANGSALSLFGRSANSAGVQASIAAASDHQVMRRSGTALGFGAVNLESANAVTGLLPTANQAVPASPTQVLFNDGGNWGGSPDLTFDGTEFFPPAVKASKRVRAHAKQSGIYFIVGGCFSDTFTTTSDS
jgi:hypothetical protein